MPPVGPPVTYPDPIQSPVYKELEKKLKACEAKLADKTFSPNECPSHTTPVYCSADGRSMSFIGYQRCWASILVNCNSPEKYGKVFCGSCGVYQQPPQVTYYYPDTHYSQQPVYWGRPTAYVCGRRGLFGLRRLWCY